MSSKLKDTKVSHLSSPPALLLEQLMVSKPRNRMGEKSCLGQYCHMKCFGKEWTEFMPIPSHSWLLPKTHLAWKGSVTL